MQKPEGCRLEVRRYVRRSRSEQASARTRAQRRAARKGARAHAEARAERRGNGAEEIAAAGAAAVVANRAGGIGAEPVTAGFALRIDALHGEAGQILHKRSLSLSGQPALRMRDTTGVAEAPLGGRNRIVGADSAVTSLWCQEKRLQWIVVWLRAERDS